MNNIFPVSTQAVSLEAGSTRCQPDTKPWRYDSVSQKCYFVDPSPRANHEAKQTCGNYGAHLPYVKTERDQTVVSGAKLVTFMSNSLFTDFTDLMKRFLPSTESIFLGAQQSGNKWNWYDNGPLESPRSLESPYRTFNRWEPSMFNC